MPVEGRDLSSRQTQDVVRDLEIGQPINSEECSETAEGVARESEGRSRVSLLRPVRQDQPRGEVNGSRVHLTGRSSPMTWRESRSHRQATGPFPSPGAYPVPCERLVYPRVHLAPASRRWPGPFFWVIAAARTKNQAARRGDQRRAVRLFFFGHDARSGRQLQHSRLLIFAQTRE